MQMPKIPKPTPPPLPPRHADADRDKRETSRKAKPRSVVSAPAGRLPQAGRQRTLIGG